MGKCSNAFFSETTNIIKAKLYMNVYWMVRRYFCIFPIWSCVITMTCGGSHLGFPIGIKNIQFVEDLPMIIPEQFGFNCPSGFREEAF
jgi:hypothetical protein